LSPVNGARFDFLRVREGKSKNPRRIPLTDRTAAMLHKRLEASARPLIFANRTGKPYLVTSINCLHRDVCAPKIGGKRSLIFPNHFVLHSLRHTMLTRLGKSGVDAFAMTRIAGHRSIVISQWYVHPSPEPMEQAFERLQLSAKSPEEESKRLPPATVCAAASGGQA
jgi:integrase